MKAAPYYRPDVKDPYAESIFLDSGAYGLYNIHVRMMDEELRKEKHKKFFDATGRMLHKPKVIRGRGDFSYYSLKPGSEFRAYCDAYGKWIRFVEGLGLKDLLYVNIDVITNPEMTWEVQTYLEEQWGLNPVPVIHAGTPLKYIQRYLETKNRSLIGLGGLGQNIGLEVYRRWADEVFTMLCPASNHYLPLVRVHGFAMTSWEFICRWPWWSVDSATWVKLGAYGWLYVPYWAKDDNGGHWDYSCPPIQINISFRSPFLHKRDRHVLTAKEMNALVTRWLKHCNLTLGEVQKFSIPKNRRSLVYEETEIGGEVKAWGVESHFAARGMANLVYLKDLEETRPWWPSPLDLKTVWQERVRSARGVLGLLPDKEFNHQSPIHVKSNGKAPERMRIYFSGSRGMVNTPEVLIPERKPHVMLTFLDMDNNGTRKRFNVYLKRKTGRRLRTDRDRRRLFKQHEN